VIKHYLIAVKTKEFFGYGCL